MEKREVIFADYKEVEALLAEFFGTDTYSGLVSDMHDAGNYEWRNDTSHCMEVEPEHAWVQPNHDNHIAAAKSRGRVHWNWELGAILEELAKRGRIETGTYVIEVGW